MAPLAESSCTVTATGKLDVMVVPVAWSERPRRPEARPRRTYVEPAAKLSKRQVDVEGDAGRMTDEILRGRDGHDRVGLRRHNVESRGGVEPVVGEVLEGQVKEGR